MNDLVKKYMQDKYGENYDKKAQDDYDSASDTNRFAQLGSNIGDAIAGNKIGSANGFFQDLNKQAKENTIGKIENDRDQYVKNTLESGQMAEMDRKQKSFDRNSEESSRYRSAVKAVMPQYAKLLGPDFENIAAGDSDKLFQLMKNKEDNDRSRENTRVLMGQRSDARQDKADEKETKRQDALAEKARPSDKQVETFSDFDNADSDLVNILTELGENSSWTGRLDGVIPDMLVGDKQVAWRSAVGKYKDAYRKAITGAGAGPTEIAMLEKRLPSEYDNFDNFKAKANEARKELSRKKSIFAKNLTSGGKNVSKFTAGAGEQQKQIIKTQTNKNTGEKRVVYSDGTSEVISSTAGR